MSRIGEIASDTGTVILLGHYENERLSQFSPADSEDVQNKIVEIQGQKVLLDSDVAQIYGVKMRDINKAVTNNPDKFPYGYIVELSKNEWDLLKSKFSTSKRGGKVKSPKAFPY